jgi:spore maturation protein CgeB
MKILFLAPWKYYDAAELFLDRAFRSLGHTTVRAATLKRTELDKMTDVDLSIVYQGLERRWVNCGDVDLLPGIKACYLMDSYKRFKDKRSDQVIEFEKGWDIILHAHHSPLEQQDSRVYFFPVGFDPQTHYWDGKPEVENIDTCFIGTSHSTRKWMLDEKILIYGNDWGTGFWRPIYNEEKRKELKHVKINLNQHFPGDTVNMRQFELPAMRRFMLTDIAWPFADGKEVATYNGTPEDFRKQAAYWLEDAELRNKIAEAGYKAVQAHSYLERAKELLRRLQKYG